MDTDLMQKKKRQYLYEMFWVPFFDGITFAVEFPVVPIDARD
jgi:hypothetical protein